MLDLSIRSKRRTNAGIDGDPVPGWLGRYHLDTMDNTVGSPTFCEGVARADFKGLELNGTSQYVNYDTQASLFSGIQNLFSVACWIKPVSGSNGIVRYIMSLGTSSAGGTGFQLLIPTTSFTARFISNTGFSASTLLTGDAWNHVVFTNNGTSRKFYINNGAPSTNTNTNNTFTATELKIGSNVTGAASFFSGCIDEIRIYDKELTAGEVALLYNYT